MKYKLWWLPNQDFDGTQKLIGTFDSEQEATKYIYGYFKSRGVEIPYFNSWKRKDTDITIIDYSSHLHYYALERIK